MSPLDVAVAQNYDAVEKRLGGAVAEGEITLRQAEAMMGGLRMAVAREDMMYRIRDIKAAVKAGKMTREEGAKIIAETKGAIGAIKNNAYRRLEVWTSEVGHKIKSAVNAGKITGKQASEKWEYFKEKELGPKLKDSVAKGVVGEQWAKQFWLTVEKAEYAERIQAAVACRVREIEAAVKSGNMKRDDGGEAIAETKKAMGKSLHDKKGKNLDNAYAKMGVSPEMLDGIKKAFAAAGVIGKQMDGSLAGTLRVVHEMKSEGDEYEMDPGIRKYFAERLRFTDKQIELVEGVARRVLRGVKVPQHGR